VCGRAEPASNHSDEMLSIALRWVKQKITQCLLNYPDSVIQHCNFFLCCDWRISVLSREMRWTVCMSFNDVAMLIQWWKCYMHLPHKRPCCISVITPSTLAKATKLLSLKTAKQKQIPTFFLVLKIFLYSCCSQKNPTQSQHKFSNHCPDPKITAHTNCDKCIKHFTRCCRNSKLEVVCIVWNIHSLHTV